MHIRRARWFGAASCALLAIAVRLIWVLCVDVRNPRTQWSWDASVYHLAAQKIADGLGYVGLYGEPEVQFPPGYPLLLSLTYRITGAPEPSTARLLNVALAGGTAALLYLLGSRTLGPRAALAGGLLYALAPGDVYCAGLTMSEVAFTFFFVLFLAAIVRFMMGGLLQWLLLGLLLGWLALLRSIALLLPVPIFVWLSRAVGPRAASARVACLLLGMAPLVGSWVARNYLHFQALIYTSDGPGVLYLAHNPLAFGSQDFAMGAARKQRPEAQIPDRGRRAVEMARADLREAISYWLTHPLHEFLLIPARFYYLYGADDWALQASKRDVAGRALVLVSPRADEALAGVANWYFHTLLALAVFGLSVARRSGPGALLICYMVVYFTLLHTLVFFAEPRFHAPLVPLLAMLAGAGMTSRCRRPADG